MRRLMSSWLLILGAILSSIPATATGGSITFRVTVGTYEPLLPELARVTRCSLSVPSGSDGLAVLQAARGKGCIESFSVYSPGFRNGSGPYLRCMEGHCEDLNGRQRVAGTWITGTEWIVWINGQFEYNYGNLGGLHYVHVRPGDMISFSFSRYFNPLICPCI